MATNIMRYLPFSRSATPLQAATYLLGISLFSISFLVFLNSSISFVITDRIGLKNGVGDIVGTLGFVDELVALVACPVWGLVSDRLGVRLVAVLGYLIIAAALVATVMAVQVYPQLLLARVLFAVGATAAATMVTAILPSLTDETVPQPPPPNDNDGAAHSSAIPKFANRRNNPRDSALSIESQLTITPERFAESQLCARADSQGISAAAATPATTRDTPDSTAKAHSSGKPSKLAGFVGLFTGCGALVALVFFLPLPAQFGRGDGVTMADAVARSFYVVASVALAVALFVYVGLRNLPGEEGKGWRLLLGMKSAAPDSTRGGMGRRDELSRIEEDSAGRSNVGDRVVAGSPPVGTVVPASSAPLPYRLLLRKSVQLGFSDADIALGYLGGFVARASSVAISLFIPLFINAFFIRNGFCQGSPHDSSPELKKECRSAYVLASIITGVAQLVGLLCAPLFGYLSSRPGRINTPVIVATTLGIAGYISFPLLRSPELKDVGGRGGSPMVFLVAALLGVSQIGDIVCSLGSLGRGVLAADPPVATVVPLEQNANISGDALETSPLLSSATTPECQPSDVLSVRLTRIQLKGSIAGVYSWCGGAAILLLTKLGGYLFDSLSSGAPFYMMAIFNGILLLASLTIDAQRTFHKSQQ